VARMRPAAKEAKEAKEAKVKESPRQALPIFLLFLDIINNQTLANPKRTASRAFSIKQDDSRKDCAGREFVTFLSYVYRFDQICRLDLTFRIFRVVILR